jgi:hypothetical protein
VAGSAVPLESVCAHRHQQGTKRGSTPDADGDIVAARAADHGGHQPAVGASGRGVPGSSYEGRTAGPEGAAGASVGTGHPASVVVQDTFGGTASAQSLRLWYDYVWRFRLTLGVLLSLLLVVGVAGAVPRRIYVANVSCTGHAYRPVQITIECRSGKFYAAHLRYGKYGGASASATAELVENNCLPNCTDGMAIESAGTIKLSDVHSCDGRLYYERIAWKLIESKGYRSPHGSGTIKPRVCGGP